VQLYSFGSYSRKVANSQQNVRLPDRVIASSVLGVAGTLGASDAILFAPNGFIPLIGIKENDFAFISGARARSRASTSTSAAVGARIMTTSTR
jgi:iron complex outermembrane receptor protein